MRRTKEQIARLPHYRFVNHLLKRFSSDAAFQYRLHLIGTVVWLLNFVGVFLVYALAPGFWASFSIFYLVAISLYGNFITDYCGVSDAEASGHTHALRGLSDAAPHHRFFQRLLWMLKGDPYTQWRLHLWLSYAWLVQLVACTFVYYLAPEIWNHYSILYVLVINLYMNLATDYSAIPGTLAAQRAAELRDGRSPWEPDPEKAEQK